MWLGKYRITQKRKHSHSITSLWKIAKYKKILSITIDNNINFKSDISELCKKASQKISALSTLPSYLHDSEKKIIFNSIIKWQFSYCPLVWMLCSRASNNMINKLHERSLRITLNYYSNGFNIVLENNNDIFNSHRNIQALLTELFKKKNELAPPIMESILNKRFNTYNLRNFQELAAESKRAIWYDRYPLLWSLFPETLNKMNSLSQFKRNIKHWICSDCHCRFCKVVFKIWDFSSVKSYTYVKLSNLGQPLVHIYIYIYTNFECRFIGCQLWHKNSIRHFFRTVIFRILQIFKTTESVKKYVLTE